MQTGCSVFVAYTALLMSNVLMDISLHADTRHRPVDLSRYQFIREIIDTSKLIIFEAIFRWDTWRRLSRGGIEQLASLFLVLYSIFCSQWSASGKPWSATDEAAEATDDFFYYFFWIFFFLFLFSLIFFFFFFFLWFFSFLFFSFFLSFFSHFFFLIKNTV